MNIKAILSDLDGTLINYHGAYDKRVPALLQKLQRQNIQFGLATGKAYFGQVAHIIQELELSPLNIVSGGGMIIDWKTGKTPWYQPISPDSTKIIVQYLASTNLAFSLETKTDAYQLRLVTPPPYKEWTKVKEFTMETIPEGVLKILVHAYSNRSLQSEIETHIKQLKNYSKDVAVIKFAFGEYFGIDITSETSTKHTATLEYGKILGISPQEIIAIGDGHNDYPLFTACGYKIAMGNAPTELKAIADAIVNTSELGGMVEALEHILTLNK